MTQLAFGVIISTLSELSETYIWCSKPTWHLSRYDCDITKLHLGWSRDFWCVEARHRNHLLWPVRPFTCLGRLQGVSASLNSLLKSTTEKPRNRTEMKGYAGQRDKMCNLKARLHNKDVVVWNNLAESHVQNFFLCFSYLSSQFACSTQPECRLIMSPFSFVLYPP